MVRNLFKLLRHNKRGRKEGESDISRAYVWILFFGSQCERRSVSKKKEKLEQMKEKGEPKKKKFSTVQESRSKIESIDC